MKFSIYNERLFCGGLKGFLDGHNLPTDELPRRGFTDSKNLEEKANQLDCLLDVSGSIFTLKNWIKGAVPVPRKKFDKLIQVLEKLTGEKVDPYEISKDYMYVRPMTDEELQDINLNFIKGQGIKTIFENAQITDKCKWILYIEILLMLDLKAYQFLSKIFGMTAKGRRKVKEAFPKSITFNDFIHYTEMSCTFIELKEKIEQNEIEKEIERYICEVRKRNPNILNCDDERNSYAINEELWRDYSEKIDLLCSGYGPMKEYSFFWRKMQLFLDLFKEDKAYIWDWLVNYCRIEDEDSFLKKIDKLCKENPDYRTANEYMPFDANEILRE